MKEILSISSVVVMCIGFLWYSKKAKKNESKPNLVVISAWLLFAIINTITYIIMVPEWYKWLFQIIAIGANLWVLVVCILSRNYLSLIRDWIIIACSIVVLTIIWIAKDTKDMHIFMQILVSISYVPLLMGIVQRKGNEPIGPWIVLTLSVVLGLIPVLIQYSNVWSLIHPIRSIVAQVIVIVFICAYDVKKAP